MDPKAPASDHGPMLLIGGPTAVGKSQVALVLAEQLAGEIISVDSMQVYRGMDIGTAKPSLEERARVPHHLIDVVEVNDPFDAARFVLLARQAVASIQRRGLLPILCGGTGLYFKAFLEGLGPMPAADLRLRAELEATPLRELLEELERCDPVGYRQIDRHNPRRVIRAVEVVRLTGQPFSQQKAGWSGTSPASFYGLSCRLEDRRQRIDRRVDEMFRSGLVEETRTLLAAGLGSNRTAMQALGYRQVLEHLQGKRSLPETIELVKRRTRQFARRQMTWFHRQLSLHWFELSNDFDTGAAAGCIRQNFERHRV